MQTAWSLTDYTLGNPREVVKSESLERAHSQHSQWESSLVPSQPLTFSSQQCAVAEQGLRVVPTQTMPTIVLLWFKGAVSLSMFFSSF